MNSFPHNWSEIKAILSHDWLTGMRGGERVLEILCEGFPTAPIYTLIHNPAPISDIINKHTIKTSWLQNIPGIKDYYRNFLPLFPGAIERMSTEEADIIISTSHCIAKGIRPTGATRHLCYCFTPMRYAWTFFDEYFGNNPVKARAAKYILKRLRDWDRESSSRVTHFVAISRHVQKRISAFYERDSDIVYPPVNTERCTPGKNPAADFDLIVSALVPYKRIDLAVRAYNRLKYPLKIVGTGTEMGRLKSIADSNIKLLGWLPDETVLELYRNCRMLVFPGEEDFGIVPVEVQACGRPVVAYAKGGALETVLDGISGIYFQEQEEDSLLAAVEKCSSKAWDKNAIRANAERFKTSNFISGLAKSIEKTIDKKHVLK